MSGIYTGNTVSICGDFPTLQYGSFGDEVKVLQALLCVDVDGDFGTQTSNAVQAVQRQFNVPPSGVANNETWGYIIAKFFGEVIT